MSVADAPTDMKKGGAWYSIVPIYTARDCDLDECDSSTHLMFGPCMHLLIICACSNFFHSYQFFRAILMDMLQMILIHLLTLIFAQGKEVKRKSCPSPLCYWKEVGSQTTMIFVAYMIEPVVNKHACRHVWVKLGLNDCTAMAISNEAYVY